MPHTVIKSRHANVKNHSEISRYFSVHTKLRRTGEILSFQIALAAARAITTTTTSTPIHARAWKGKALAGYNSQQIPTNNNIHKMLIIIISLRWKHFVIISYLYKIPTSNEPYNQRERDTSTGIDADASKGKSWPGYSWQQSGLMFKMWDTGFIRTLCHCCLPMINWIMPNLHVVIPMESDGP